MQVNGALSTERLISSGCPQGTCIGPLILLLFIDSAVIIEQIAKTNDEQDCDRLQRTMREFDAWSSAVDLKLSVEKCVVLHIGKGNRRHFIDGRPVTPVDAVKDLGITTTPNLRYSEHTTDVSRRAA